jgi:curved DNA-binding protein
VIRLAGQGMPRASGGSGDMYVAVKVVLPQKLTEAEREAIQKIAAQRSDENVRSHLL